MERQRGPPLELQPHPPPPPPAPAHRRPNRGQRQRQRQKAAMEALRQELNAYKQERRRERTQENEHQQEPRFAVRKRFVAKGWCTQRLPFGWCLARLPFFLCHRPARSIEDWREEVEPPSYQESVSERGAETASANSTRLDNSSVHSLGSNGFRGFHLSLANVRGAITINFPVRESRREGPQEVRPAPPSREVRDVSPRMPDQIPDRHRGIVKPSLSQSQSRSHCHLPLCVFQWLDAGGCMPKSRGAVGVGFPQIWVDTPLFSPRPLETNKGCQKIFFSFWGGALGGPRVPWPVVWLATSASPVWGPPGRVGRPQGKWSPSLGTGKPRRYPRNGLFGHRTSGPHPPVAHVKPLAGLAKPFAGAANPLAGRAERGTVAPS